MFSLQQVRLWPRGPRKHKFFSIVVCYKKNRHRGAFLERLGVFNPHLKSRQLSFNGYRLAFWLNKGVLLHPSTIFLLSYMARAHHATTRS